MSNIIVSIATSSLPLFPILTWLCFFIFMWHSNKLFTKFIPQTIMSKYIIPVAAHLTWAWDFLIHYSLFPNSQHNIIRLQDTINGDHQYPGLYKPEPASKEEADCAVCLCKIEEEEEIREVMRCGHTFHRECLDRWVQHRNGTCPLCRCCIAPPTMLLNEAVGLELIISSYTNYLDY